MTNDSFGIDHPLVTVHDIVAVAARYEALGFAPTALGRGGWGTVNRRVMFPDNFIELISIGDPAAAEADPGGGHSLGRRLRDRLTLGEGISLLALRSTNAGADEQEAVARGAASAGQVEFGCAVRLPDGTQHEAVVTLAILPDDETPGLSVFLCQQHTPHLVWSPDWLVHPNGADAITAVAYFAPDPLAVMPRAQAVWGADAVMREFDGLRVSTAGGVVHVYGAEAIDTRFPGMTLTPDVFARAPCGVAISIHTADFRAARERVSAIPGVLVQEERVLIPADYAGGVILELHI